ncbi:MAG: DUF4856 domain-containing protein [Flavobacteriaceae bacterium]
MTKLYTYPALILVLILSSCTDSNESPEEQVIAPSTYTFERNGLSSVSFSGQTARIAMAQEISSALVDPSTSEEQLDEMFAKGTGFSDASLNESGKTVRSKMAASYDYFNSNATESTLIKSDLDTWISNQVTEVFPTWNQEATAGKSGGIQELGGGSTRNVNAQGLEYNQAFAKSLIGGLMLDQIVNNYLSVGVLDAGENRAENDEDILVMDKNYTSMEHKWDEAFGYLYGAETDITNPTLSADSFLNKYLGRVEGDEDFQGIAEIIYNAFTLGRAAIVAKNYEVRDEQADIIREELSKVIGIRAVYYLQQGKLNLNKDMASAFHDLSEGYGFIYSLQFTRQPGTSSPYFTKSEVDQFIEELMLGNGFWEVSEATLDALSTTIATNFDFTVAEAAN